MRDGGAVAAFMRLEHSSASGFPGRLSSARRSILRLHPWVETVQPRRPCARAAQVLRVRVYLRRGAAPRLGRPPRVVYGLRAIGTIGLATSAWPRGHRAGARAERDGLGVLAALVLLAAWRGGQLPRGARCRRRALRRLVPTAAPAAALLSRAAAGRRGHRRDPLRVRDRPRCGSRAAARASSSRSGWSSQAIAIAAAGQARVEPPPPGRRTLPWFFVLRLMRELREPPDRAETLVDERRELARRRRSGRARRAGAGGTRHARRARPLALRPRAAARGGPRLLARDRDSDPEVVADDRARAPPPRRAASTRRAARSPHCAATRSRAPTGWPRSPTPSRNARRSRWPAPTRSSAAGWSGRRDPSRGRPPAHGRADRRRRAHVRGALSALQRPRSRWPARGLPGPWSAPSWPGSCARS